MDIPAWKQLYPTLRGAERFRLVALAASREDSEEMNRLVSTCPRVDVSRLDGEFLAMRHAAAAAAQAMAAPWAWLVGWLEATRALDRFASTGLGEIGFGPNGVEGIKRLVATARARAQGELGALWVAYQDLSREVGLDLGFMVRSLPSSVLSGLPRDERRVLSVPADEACTEAWRAHLRRAWDEALEAEPILDRSADPA